MLTPRAVALAVVVALGCGPGGPPSPGATADPPMPSTPPTSRSRTPAFDIQGHRGARGLRPENTLPSFEVALDLGVTSLELDLHLTADDEVVIWHDPKLDPAKCRLDPSAADPLPPDPADPKVQADLLRMRRLTVAQLARYRCDLNPDPTRFPDQVREPTAIAGDHFEIVPLSVLMDFVAEYSGSTLKTEAQRATAAAVRFNIEIKRGDPADIDDGFDGSAPGLFERRVAKVIADHDLVQRVTIQSFEHRSLWAIKTLEPNLELAALTEGGGGAGGSAQGSAEVDLAELVRRGAAVWSPDHETLSRERIEQAHAAGLWVIPFTVNEADRMQTLIDWGLDGIITDRPDRLLQLRAASGP